MCCSAFSVSCASPFGFLSSADTLNDLTCCGFCVSSCACFTGGVVISESLCVRTLGLLPLGVEIGGVVSGGGIDVIDDGVTHLFGGDVELPVLWSGVLSSSLFF